MKPATTKAAEKAILRHYKTLVKSEYPDYMGQYQTETETGTTWTYCNGITMMTSPEPIPGIPVIEYRHQLRPEIMKDQINAARDKWRRRRGGEYHAPAEAVTRKALETWRREHKDKKEPFRIQDGPQEIGINSRYLLDFMTIYPNARLYVAGPLDPVLLLDPGKQDQRPVACIMPIRIAASARRTA